MSNLDIDFWLSFQNGSVEWDRFQTTEKLREVYNLYSKENLNES